MKESLFSPKKAVPMSSFTLDVILFPIGYIKVTDNEILNHMMDLCDNELI
jgi:hypothetical protein